MRFDLTVKGIPVFGIDQAVGAGADGLVGLCVEADSGRRINAVMTSRLLAETLFFRFAGSQPLTTISWQI